MTRENILWTWIVTFTIVAVVALDPLEWRILFGILCLISVFFLLLIIKIEKGDLAKVTKNHTKEELYKFVIKHKALPYSLGKDVSLSEAERIYDEAKEWKKTQKNTNKKQGGKK